jgi:hypothetical protein
MQQTSSEESNSDWSDWNALEWRKILSLPTLQWAEPFLKYTGLPEALLQHKEEWLTIYTKLHQKIGSPTTAQFPKPDSYGDFARPAISTAFCELADQLGRDVAIELEKWVKLHFFCQEASIALRQWGIVLSYALPTDSDERKRKQVAPPHSLLCILPSISNLAKYEIVASIKDEMMLAAPPPPFEQSPYEKLDKCYEATLLGIAISQGTRFQALQVIGNRTDELARAEIVAWAGQQLEVLSRYKRTVTTGKLCGVKYLQGTNPCFSSFEANGFL